MAELHQSNLFAPAEKLSEQSRKHLSVPLAEVQEAVRGSAVGPTMREVDPLARHLGDPARRVDDVAIAI